MSDVKRNKYVVEVRSHVSAEMLVFANSKEEAWKIADRDMAESLERMLKNAPPHPFLKNRTGYTEALKTSVKRI